MIRTVCSLALVALLTASSAWAQGGGQAPAPPVQGITLDLAKKMMAAAEAAAVALNARVAIAIVDMNGDLVAMQRMDGVSARGVITAQGKARAALLFGQSTRQVQEAAQAGKPVTATLVMPVAGAWEITVQQDRKSTRLNSSHSDRSRMPSSA